MIIGVPKEIKNSEHRVGLTEGNVHSLVQEGHKVLVQKKAGAGSYIFDEQYIKAGAQIVDTIEDVYKKSDMIVKVKEPLPEEYPLLKENQILFTFLHLAAEPKLTDVLCEKKVKAVAYETIEDKDGNLPLLKPMSQVAGRVGVQSGAFYLQNHQGGRGLLLGGVPGVEKARVVILGGGVAGTHATMMAVGLQADVKVLDINLDRLEYLDQIFHGRVHTLFSSQKNIEEQVAQADLLIGAVLITGRKTPHIVTKKMVASMPRGSVIVDLSVDQGGCVETCRPTSHEEPIYKINEVIHYCVPNIPGVVSRTSTYALTNVSFKFTLNIANKNLETALKENPYLKKGLNTYKGFITYKPVAEALGKKYQEFI